MTRLLIIDDDLSVRQSFSRYLTDMEFEVVAVSSAEEGLALLAHESFQVAVVDVRLPGMDGDIFIPQAHEIQPLLGYILVTGSASYQPSASLVKMGMQPSQVFRKPILEMESLVVAINKVAARGKE